MALIDFAEIEKHDVVRIGGQDVEIIAKPGTTRTSFVELVIKEPCRSGHGTQKKTILMYGAAKAVLVRKGKP